MNLFNPFRISLLVFLSCIGVISHGLPQNDKKITDPHTMNWEEILDLASGSEVNFYMWGGSSQINSWIDNIVAPRLKDIYNIKLNRFPMDAAVFINKLIAEKQASNIKHGVIDLVWINGENFRNARQADLLWGPYTDILPNFNLYVDPASVATDFGYPTEGYEAPYGRAGLVFTYDQNRLSSPPKNIDELTEWIKSNPGRFTYPQPPDFTGSAFLRILLYALNGGPEKFLAGYDEELGKQALEKLIAWLEDIKPYLWQRGNNYPRTSAALDKLFSRNEVDYSMNYNISHASSMIVNGQYPPGAQTYVMDNLALYNTHFTAIPFNAPNKTAALVLSNFLLSPEMQISKNDPANWGDFSVLSPELLPEEFSLHLAALDMGPAIISREILHRNGVPEISARYVELIEKAWDERILKVN